MTNTPTCITCGQHHPGCTAHNRQGNPCGNKPLTGLTVCHRHGGATRASQAKRRRHLAAVKAATAAARFNARTDLNPADALLDLVHYQAGIVAYWRARVEQIDDDNLEWGTVKTEQGSERGETTDITTEQAGAHIAYAMLREAQHDLAVYATAALKAGVEERRVQLAERQGSLVAAAIRSILAALNLTPEQQALVPTIVPAQLRLLTTTPAQEPPT